MVRLAEKVKATIMPRLTRLEPIARTEHQMFQAMERARQAIWANAKAMMTDYQVRAGQSVVPGHPFFPWMLRHTAWCTPRFQSQGPIPRTSSSYTLQGTELRAVLVTSHPLQ